MSETSRGNWIQTYSGRQFFPMDPRPEDIDPVDIAHALSNVCRFTGHVSGFYSVAQHSVLISERVPEEDALWGLLHDASEAYIADVARPVKRSEEMLPYREVERKLMLAVCLRFCLPIEMPASVAEADHRMLWTEKRDLMADEPAPWGDPVEPYRIPVTPWAPQDAKKAFESRLEELLPKGVTASELAEREEEPPKALRIDTSPTRTALENMSFRHYQLWTRRTAVYPGARTGAPEAMLYTALGLVNEAGEFCGKLKKVIRGDHDHGPKPAPGATSTQLAMALLRRHRGSADIASELGDVLWYLARAADEQGRDLGEIAAENYTKLEDRKNRGVIKGSGDTR